MLVFAVDYGNGDHTTALLVECCLDGSFKILEELVDPSAEQLDALKRRARGVV